MNWRGEISKAVKDLYQVTNLGGYPLEEDYPSLEFLPAPHKPQTRIPVGMMAVYCFCENDSWLKIRVVGAKSSARYTSQHYILTALTVPLQRL